MRAGSGQLSGFWPEKMGSFLSFLFFLFFPENWAFKLTVVLVADND